MKFTSGVFAADQGVVALFSDFESQGEMWSGQGPRERRVQVKFANAFVAPPLVHLSLNMFDADCQHNQRFDLVSEDITTTDFTIIFRTWGDSKIARARASWLAIGELTHSDEQWNL